MTKISSRQPSEGDSARLADRLHSAAIHLLRRLRSEDVAAGLTGPQLSALSVVVFGGPITMKDLAAAEQVRPPTITRLVKELVHDGLVSSATDPSDTRVKRLTATPKGRRLLDKGNHRRVAKLAADLSKLGFAERRTLARAAELLETLAFPSERPGRVKSGE